MKVLYAAEPTRLPTKHGIRRYWTPEDAYLFLLLYTAHWCRSNPPETVFSSLRKLPVTFTLAQKELLKAAVSNDELARAQAMILRKLGKDK